MNTWKARLSPHRNQNRVGEQAFKYPKCRHYDRTAVDDPRGYGTQSKGPFYRLKADAALELAFKIAKARGDIETADFEAVRAVSSMVQLVPKLATSRDGID